MPPGQNFLKRGNFFKSGSAGKQGSRAKLVGFFPRKKQNFSRLCVYHNVDRRRSEARVRAPCTRHCFGIYFSFSETACRERKKGWEGRTDIWPQRCFKSSSCKTSLLVSSTTPPFFTCLIPLRDMFHRAGQNLSYLQHKLMLTLQSFMS